MTTVSSLSLRHPVQGIYLRLWLSHLYNWGRSGLWLTVLLLILLNLLHWYVVAVPLAITLASLLLPLLAALSLSLLFHRPTLQEAVRVTDRTIGANDLLLTAWDQQQLPAAGDAAALVMHQAAQQLPHWQRQISQQPWPRPGRSLLAALLLLPLGLIPLTLLERRELQTQPTVTMIAAPVTAEPSANPLAEIIQQLKPAPLETPAEGAVWQPGGNNPLDGNQTDPEADQELDSDTATLKIADTDVTDGSAPQPQLADRPAGSRAESEAEAAEAEKGEPDDGTARHHIERRYQDQAGISRDDGNGKVSATATSLAVAELQLQRRSNQGDGNLGRSDLYDATANNNSNPRPGPAAAAQVIDNLIPPGRYSPVQRAYIARYFQRLQSGTEK